MKAVSTRKTHKTIVEAPNGVTKENLFKKATKYIRGKFKIIKDEQETKN